MVRKNSNRDGFRDEARASGSRVAAGSWGEVEQQQVHGEKRSSSKRTLRGGARAVA